MYFLRDTFDKKQIQNYKELTIRLTAIGNDNKNPANLQLLIFHNFHNQI